MNNETLIRKENNFSTFTDLNKTVAILTNDISIFLAEELEELNVSSYIFKNGMERALSRVLNSLIKREESVVIFPDSVPGFTLMIFKKTDNQISSKSKKINIERNPVKEIKETEALNKVITKFFNKNQQKVLIIENSDIIFALFPVSDARKNLKELELYITF